MAERVVISRSRRVERLAAKEFQFHREQIPGLDGDGKYSSEIRNYRIHAWEAFERIPMPTTSEEAWRRTDIRGLHASEFLLPWQLDLQTLNLPNPPDALLQPLAGEAHAGQIVITPNGANAELDSSLVRQGVIFTDFRSAEKNHPELLANLVGQVVRAEEGKFAALAAAMAWNGVFLYVPHGVVIEKPLHSILWGPGVNLAYLSHLLVWLEDGASATYVHESASPSETHGQGFHAGLVEINLAAESNLHFVELQSWGDHVWNFSHERAQIGRDASLDWVFGAIGSRLTKNFSEIDMAGRGARGRMSGFYFTDGDQHLDHDTQQNHLAPNTTSDLLFKGALRESSRSVWQGMIYVAPGAQKTDGYQANRNLVLSPQARADSIPGLEILADDVRCTHGATVGKIDPEQVFYLSSRGISYPEAERLIVEGFFDPIMQRIPFEGVRNRFQDAIMEKMG